jgi:hypothetical protein
MWGWQPWTYRVDIPGSNGLSEVFSLVDIPGGTYYPYGMTGGATYIDTDYSISNPSPEPGSSIDISPRSYINGIPVDTNNLSPATTNMVLVYKSDSKKFVFISAQEVVGYSDNNQNPDDVDLGNF